MVIHVGISANDEHQPASVLSPAGTKTHHVEGGGPSSVQMGQENVIALLLQQQQEVLREIRDQRKGLALSQENKQEIARLVLSSLKKQRPQAQPATSDPPHHPSPGLCTARKPRTASKHTGKRRAVMRRRQRNSRSSRDQDQAKNHNPTPTTQESGLYEYSSSSDQCNGTSSPSATLEPVCFPLERTISAHEHRSGTPSPASGTTVIRQRVEKRAEQMEVSLDGLWLPALSLSSGLGSTGTAARRKRGSSDDAATTARGGRRADSSRPAMPPAAYMLQARKAGNLHVYDARDKPTRRRKVRPVTVDSHASRQCAQAPHLRRQEGGCMPVTGGFGNRLGLNNDAAEGKYTHGGDNMISGDDDDDDGGDDGRTPRLVENFAQRGATGDDSNRGAESAAATPGISRNTASMLQRSHALVARAKAYCGQAARSSAADYGNREGGAEFRLSPYGPTNANSSPIATRHHGGNVDSFAPDSDADGGTEEAGDILFAYSPSLTAGASLSASSRLGDVTKGDGESRVSQSATAGAERSRVPEGQRYSVDFAELKHTAQAETATCNDGTVPAVLQPTIRGGAENERGKDPENERQNVAAGVEPVRLAATDDARSRGPAGPETRQARRGSLASSTSSVGAGNGRWRGGSGSSCARKPRRKPGKELGRGSGGVEDASLAKVDTEWENEIAKNILSLYQTKLKADLDVKKSAKEYELMRKQRGYLTIEEEEDSLLEERQQQRQLGRYSNRAVTAAPSRVCFPSNRDTHDGPKPSTASSTSGKSSGLDLNTAREAATSTRARETGGNKIATPSPSPRRPVTVATKPREVVVGRDLSLGRIPQSPPRPAAGTSDGADKGSGEHVVPTGSKGRGGFRGSKAITVSTRGGGEAVVVVPKRPRPIWFAGSGAIQAEWSALPGGARVVRDLEGLEEQGRYSKYVAVVEGLLTAYLRADDQRGPGELVKKLWRQLVATCIAFGVRSTENRRFERALELLKRAGTLVSRQVLDKRASQELQAFVHDAYGLYFLRRGKSSAALDYVQKAMKTHARMRDWGHVTKCHLHSSVVLSKLNRHDEALRCLGQVLSMVEEGNLDVGGNSPQKLCLVAICYHNMAVEQLILRHAGEACMSSQNARRLARLCLSYSNRWLHSFEGTHKLALAELARSLPAAGSALGGGGERGGDGERKEEQRDILQRLTEELFS